MQSTYIILIYTYTSTFIFIHHTIHYINSVHIQTYYTHNNIKCTTHFRKKVNLKKKTFIILCYPRLYLSNQLKRNFLKMRISFYFYEKNIHIYVSKMREE